MTDNTGKGVVGEVSGEEGIVEISTEMVGKRRMKGSMIKFAKTFSMALSIFSILYLFNVPARLGILAINTLTYLNIILSGLVVLTFIAFPGSQEMESKIPWYDFALIILGVTPCLYYFVD